MTSTTATGPPPLRRVHQTGAAALAVLTIGQLVVHLVLVARPNPGLAATAVLPLAAALVLLRWRTAWAALPTLAVVATIVGTRAVELPFDLARPAQLLAFGVAAVQLAACGVAAAAALRLLFARAPRLGGSAVTAAGGLAIGTLAAAGLLVLAPQGDQTGGLTAAEVEALPLVTLVDYRFEPAQLRIAEGDMLAIRFTNDGSLPHAFRVESLGIDVQVPSGRTRTVVLRPPAGVHDLECSVGDHAELGMRGRVVVDATAPGDEPAAHSHG